MQSLSASYNTRSYSSRTYPQATKNDTPLVLNKNIIAEDLVTLLINNGGKFLFRSNSKLKIRSVANLSQGKG